MTEEEKYRRARERVEEIRSFYIHVMVYVIVNIVLFIINAVNSPGAWWFYWPLFGWGVAVFIHGVSVWRKGTLWQELGREEDKGDNGQVRF